MSNRLPFTHEDVEQILKVVDGLSDVEVTLEVGELRLHVRKGAAGGAAQASPRPVPSLQARPSTPVERHTAPARARDVQLPEGAIAIRAPMLGTFYRAPSPADPPFVEVGQKISPGDQVCLIEVMKLFNSVNAEVGGTIVEIPVDSGAMVEFDQVLFVVQPG